MCSRMPSRRERRELRREGRSGTLGTRTTHPEETQSGRRLYELLQRGRQGTTGHEGRTGPTPRRQSVPEETPPGRTGRVKKAAMTLGGIAAVGTGIWWLRNRRRQTRMRRYD